MDRAHRRQRNLDGRICSGRIGVYLKIQCDILRQRRQPVDAGHRNPPFVPAFHGMRIDPLIMTVPDIAATLRFNVRAGVVSVCMLQRGGCFAVAEGPQLHPLDDAAIGISEHAVILVELVHAAVVVIAVDAENAQHIFVIAVPAEVFAVIDRPRRHDAGGVTHGFCHRIEEPSFGSRLQRGAGPEHLRLLSVGAVIAKYVGSHRSYAGEERRRKRHFHVIEGIEFAQHDGDAAIFMFHDGVRPIRLAMRSERVRVVRAGELNSGQRKIHAVVVVSWLDDVVAIENLFVVQLVVERKKSAA